jgi:hypothetical protein
MRLQDRFLTFLAAGAIAGLLSASLVDAHPRARFHRHERSTAVIVLGKPKTAPHVVVVDGARHGILDLNVKPKATRVWIDGVFRGTCGTFDGFPNKLVLAPGIHTIRFVTPTGIEATRDVRVRPGVEFNVGLELR